MTQPSRVPQVGNLCGRQTNNPLCFDIDGECNIIMNDYWKHCVYVFNQEGEQIHKFGKRGQSIGEFHRPWEIALDNTGHIIVVCEKDTNCFGMLSSLRCC